MPGSSAQRVAASGQRTLSDAVAVDTVEPEALSATHWFDAEQGGEPYAATIRFTGRRIGVQGKPGPRDTFVKEETVKGIVPGSGRVSITTWVYGLEPGEWTVTADLLRSLSGTGARRPSAGGKAAGAHTLPRAAWSWRRWALATGQFAPVKTRWAPLVRMARMPAVIPGTWAGLITLGILAGAGVQTALLSREGVAVGPSLIVDLLAVLAGIIVAKLWFVALQPRGTWRQAMAEGWTVDGLIVGALFAAVGLLMTFDLPIGIFLDASAPGLFFGVAIGRLGCFFTGCCAGRCTRSRWGVWSSDRRVGARRIPAQLLESATGLLIGIATTLVILNVAPSVRGAIFVGAFAVYVLVRQYILRLRAEPHHVVRARLTAAAAGLVLVADLVVLLVSAS